MAPQDNMVIDGVKGLPHFSVDAIASITYGLTNSHIAVSDPDTRSSFVGAMDLYSYANQGNVGLNPFQLGTGFIGGNYAFNDNGEFVPVERGMNLEMIG